MKKSKWTEHDGMLHRGIDDNAMRELNGKPPRLTVGGYIAVAIALALAIGIVYHLSIRYGW